MNQGKTLFEVFFPDDLRPSSSPPPQNTEAQGKTLFEVFFPEDAIKIDGTVAAEAIRRNLRPLQKEFNSSGPSQVRGRGEAANRRYGEYKALSELAKELGIPVSREPNF